MKRHLAVILRLISITLITFLGGVSNRLMAQDVNIDTEDIPKCMVVMHFSETKPEALPDSVYNAIAGITIYKVNRTELRSDDPFVGLLDRTIIPLANLRDWTLLGMEVRGGASPEGPYENNVRLSRGRAARLFEYINGKLLHSRRPDSVEISTVAEDYGYLLWLLERDGDSGAATLREIIDRRGIADHAAIKADLRKVDGGRLWKRLLADYFPAVRAGRVVLYFMPYRHLGDTVHIVAEPLPEPVRAFRLPEPEPLFGMPEPLSIERRHMLAVGTNVLYDAFYMPQYGWAPMPNLNLEFYPRTGKFTYRFQFLFPYYHRWSKHKFFQIRDYHFEVRRYFNPDFYHTGWYLGAYVNNNIYGIGLSATKGWEGEGLGGGLKGGYVMRLGRSKRWRLEFHAAVGCYVTRYDPYVYGNPITGEYDGDYYYDWTGGSEAFHRRNHRMTWFGPTEVGVTLSYDLLFWRQSRKGVSFLNHETVR